MYKHFKKQSSNILEEHLFTVAKILFITMTILLYGAALTTIRSELFFYFIVGKFKSSFLILAECFIDMVIFYLIKNIKLHQEIIMAAVKTILILYWNSERSITFLFITNTIVIVSGLNIVYQLFYKNGFIFSTLNQGLKSTKKVFMKFAWFITILSFKINFILNI